MKLITFFFFLGIFQVSASVYGQRGTVTLNLNELTMEDIFTAINRQLKYDIFYSDDELDVARKIKLTDSKMEVSKLLKEVLQDDYSYEFLNNDCHPSGKTTAKSENCHTGNGKGYERNTLARRFGGDSGVYGRGVYG